MPTPPTAREATTKGQVHLSVADFGPIVRADVELRPLTVLVGPSNTGKSYLAVLIYLLHRFFGGGPQPFAEPMRLGPFFLRHGAGLRTEAAKRETHAFCREVARRASDAESGPVRIPNEVARWVQSVFAAQEDQLEAALRECFGEGDLGSLVRKEAKGACQVRIRRDATDDSSPFEHLLTIARQPSLRVSIPDTVPFEAELARPAGLGMAELWAVIERASSESRPADFVEWLQLQVLDGIILRHLSGTLGLPAYYLPAERAAVMHARSVVANATGVMADFLRQLLVVDRGSPANGSQGVDAGTRLEESILRGSVQIDRSGPGPYPRFSYRPHGWTQDLSMRSASSMVSELAPIVLYLRYVVRPGNVLIVEEPESHLHPQAQSLLAREIVELVATGYRVIVTTHSDWMLNQFANHLRLSELGVERRDGLDEFRDLRRDQFGAWLFRPTQRPRGSFVEEIRFDPDRGGLDSDYGDVADALYNTWAEIGNRIEEDKATDPS